MCLNSIFFILINLMHSYNSNMPQLGLSWSWGFMDVFIQGTRERKIMFCCIFFILSDN